MATGGSDRSDILLITTPHAILQQSARGGIARGSGYDAKESEPVRENEWHKDWSLTREVPYV